jgi:hypothetical protein
MASLIFPFVTFLVAISGIPPHWKSHNQNLGPNRLFGDEDKETDLPEENEVGASRSL